MDMTIIFKTFIMLIVTIIMAYVIPMLKEKYGIDRYKKLEMWVKTAVECAEMIFTKTGMGEQKKAYVERYINTLLNEHNIYMSAAELNAFIESAVMQLKLKENP